MRPKSNKEILESCIPNLISVEQFYQTYNPVPCETKTESIEECKNEDYDNNDEVKINI